jgi:hypothetical protein
MPASENLHKSRNAQTMGSKTYLSLYSSQIVASIWVVVQFLACANSRITVIYLQYASKPSPFQLCGRGGIIPFLNAGQTLFRITSPSMGTGGSLLWPKALHRKCSAFDVITLVHPSPPTNKFQDSSIDWVSVIEVTH